MALLRRFPYVRICNNIYFHQRACLSEATKNGIPKPSHTESHEEEQSKGKDKKKFYAALIVGGIVTWHVVSHFTSKGLKKNVADAPTLDMFTAKEVQKHKTKDTGIWVTYGHAVYDVTNYIKDHPGDDNIMLMAAGGPLEPYWDKYKLHKPKDIDSMLDTMKIGLIKNTEKEKLLEIQNELIKKQSFPDVK